MLKIANGHINAIKLLKYNGKGTKKDILKLLISLAIILLLFMLAVFVLILGFVPNVLASIPLALKLILMFMLLTFYGCFISLFLGLGKVVGAGGSATNTIKVLFSYICEAANINQPENNTKNQQINSEKK